MTALEFKRAWPDYPDTHDISDTELDRIAARATDVTDAERIWDNEAWWRDPE